MMLLSDIFDGALKYVLMVVAALGFIYVLRKRWIEEGRHQVEVEALKDYFKKDLEHEKLAHEADNMSINDARGFLHEGYHYYK